MPTWGGNHNTTWTASSKVRGKHGLAHDATSRPAICAAERTVDLFDGDRLGQVAGFVDVVAFGLGDRRGEYL